MARYKFILYCIVAYDGALMHLNIYWVFIKADTQVGLTYICNVNGDIHIVYRYLLFGTPHPVICKYDT